VKSIVLDYCWVCETRFVGSGGSEIKHDHHLVPRAYGGVDGPTVTICDTHHSKTHRIAEALIAKRSHFTYLSGESEDRRKKLLYMANVIYNAWLAFHKDPNKAVSTVLTLDKNQQKMVDALKSIYPKARGRSDIINIALLSLYRKHFTDVQ